MQLTSRKTLLISTFLISFAILSSSVFAAVVQVNLAPTETVPGKDTEFSLSVNNLAGDNVNKIELSVPQKDSMPLYMIKEIGNPAGWTYESRYAVGASSPFKVIWSTASSGIAAGKSMNFNFVATSSSEGGDFNFEWKATDLSGKETFDKIVVTNFNPVVTDLGITTVDTIVAGKEFNFAVTAQDQNGNVKSDYTGTVKFSSSDPLAILPSDYTFQTSDNGAKIFKMRLKTVGEQEIKITDGSREKSVIVTVQQGDIILMQMKLSNGTTTPGAIVTADTMISDMYGNAKDVTKDTAFEIDKEAKGKWDVNSYTAEAIGKWTVTATYTTGGKKIYSGMLLTVVSELPKPQPQTEPEKKVSMEIISDDNVNVQINSTKLFSLTIKNTGEDNIPNVSIYFTGYPEKWLGVSPSIVNIEKGKSQRFTVTISAPEKIDPANVEFLALSSSYSSEKLSASKKVLINVTESAPEASATGKIALNKNLTYLGIAIVVAIVLIILFWLMFLKGDDSKKKKSDE